MILIIQVIILPMVKAFNNSLLLQWGTFTNFSKNSNPLSLNVAYANSNYVIVVTNGSSGDSYDVTVHTQTPTTFSAKWQQRLKMYIAIGTI